MPVTGFAVLGVIEDRPLQQREAFKLQMDLASIFTSAITKFVAARAVCSTFSPVFLVCSTRFDL
jgi:hypothetical protein